MDSIADSGTGGDAPTPITGASTDREDEDAGMGLLADGRRRREPQTITRPVPVLIRPAQAATSGTLTRPCMLTGGSAHERLHWMSVGWGARLHTWLDHPACRLWPGPRYPVRQVSWTAAGSNVRAPCRVRCRLISSSRLTTARRRLSGSFSHS